METTKDAARSLDAGGSDLIHRFWGQSWTYIKTVVDVVREPILILDKDLRVLAANESFYRTFQVQPGETEKRIVYELGNGQWDIPALRKLLEDILPKHSFFKGFEVNHDFPTIGKKIMLLNARRIYTEDSASEIFPPIILLAMEDVSDIMVVAETLASHANQLEARLAERTQNLEAHIGKLEKEVSELKKDGNRNHPRQD